jgi:hypothetical protein
MGLARGTQAPLVSCLAVVRSMTDTRSGQRPVDVVKQLQLDPDVSEALHARWAKMRGLLVLPSEARSKVQELLTDWDSGQLRTANDLLAFLRKWVPDESVRTYRE